MRRSITPLAMSMTVAACSLLYDPRLLPPLAHDSSVPGDDAAHSPDLGSNADDAPAVSDASPGLDVAQELDATLELDAPPPIDTPACGGATEMCCGGSECDAWLECADGRCKPCGGFLQGCCDPGNVCMSGLCIGSTCA